MDSGKIEATGFVDLQRLEPAARSVQRGRCARPLSRDQLAHAATDEQAKLAGDKAAAAPAK